jgi:hypothetical protein
METTPKPSGNYIRDVPLGKQVEVSWAPLSETLRSAGARIVLATGFYRHSAPLETEAKTPSEPRSRRITRCFAGRRQCR